MSQGFFHNPDDDKEQYVFGTTSPLPLKRLQPDRNWRPFVIPELQNARGYDPLDCASINTERAIQILIKRLYGIDVQYSERWLAWATDTHLKGGNDPHYVAEFLRKSGIPLEIEWPSDVPQEDFYDTPPASLWQSAKLFLAEWDFKHDTVRGLDAMWDALQDSPLGCSVGWNQIDENGYWFKSHDGPDTHWSVICVGAKYGEYWEFIDSAEPVIKRARWDMKPQLVKRYTIRKRLPTVEELTLYVRILTLIRDFLIRNWKRCTDTIEACLAVLLPAPPPQTAPEPPKPVEVPQTPPEPKRDLLGEFCAAIAQYEGGPGDLNHRNNNPGNLRSWHTQIGTNKGFAVFATWEDGMKALRELVTRAATGKSSVYKPTDTFLRFFSRYAPAADHNDPVRYASFIAKKLGLPVETQIKQLLA